MVATTLKTSENSKLLLFGGKIVEYPILSLLLEAVHSLIFNETTKMEGAISVMMIRENKVN